jgi:protein-tyrosine phosphatase
MPPRFTVLLVCTANICRSPLAEHLLRMSLPALGTETLPAFRVESAGVRGWDGAEMDPLAAAELRRRGGEPGGFRARSFTVALGLDADLILAATADHRRVVLEEVPKALHKTFTLLEFAHLVSSVEAVHRAAAGPVDMVRRAAGRRGAARLDEYDVTDPYGQPAAVHQQTAAVIENATRRIAAGLSAR